MFGFGLFFFNESVPIKDDLYGLLGHKNYYFVCSVPIHIHHQNFKVVLYWN